MSASPWYLLYCKAKEQQRAILHLQRQDVICYSPHILVEKIRRGMRKVELEPLFPSYLFISFAPQKIAFVTIRSTRGVVDFVRQGMQPCEVPLSLITNLKKHEQACRAQDLQNAFVTGQKVEILEGPWQGVDAIFKEADGLHRSVLLIKMLNQPVEISLSNQNICHRQS
ncbi:MAG: transcription/translation regulatory transformer protein RfaH [Vibrionaceae bacterium]